MALFIILKSSKNQCDPVDRSVNLLERHVPFTNLPTLVNEEIDFIQADCDELEYIIDKFTYHGEDNNGGIQCVTIPVPFDRTVVRWYGDIAKTIYYNL